MQFDWSKWKISKILLRDVDIVSNLLSWYKQSDWSIHIISHKEYIFYSVGILVKYWMVYEMVKALFITAMESVFMRGNGAMEWDMDK